VIQKRNKCNTKQRSVEITRMQPAIFLGEGIFWWGGEGKEHFWGRCIHYYAYRKMTAAKMAFGRFGGIAQI